MPGWCRPGSCGLGPWPRLDRSGPSELIYHPEVERIGRPGVYDRSGLCVPFQRSRNEGGVGETVPPQRGADGRATHFLASAVGGFVNT